MSYKEINAAMVHVRLKVYLSTKYVSTKGAIYPIDFLGSCKQIIIINILVNFCRNIILTDDKQN